jgi:UDP-N-acetylmuramoyl-tripeptide--D-alanyl-D-alanine ligase
MARLRLDEIALRTGGRIVQGDPAAMFDTYNIDSRLSRPGELFFAIVAQRNGHDFVPDALAKGAQARLSPGNRPDRPRPRSSEDTVAYSNSPGRSGRQNPTVIGITGSIGKTTTKEFAASLLSCRFKVLKSEGNFNNHLGLALSLLKLRPGQEVAVLEMGTSAPGEIRTLTRIAPPDIAVITNVNPVHLEFAWKQLPARRNPRRRQAGAAAVLNGDDPGSKSGALDGRRSRSA